MRKTDYCPHLSTPAIHNYPRNDAHQIHSYYDFHVPRSVSVLHSTQNKPNNVFINLIHSYLFVLMCM